MRSMIETDPAFRGNVLKIADEAGRAFLEEGKDETAEAHKAG